MSSPWTKASQIVALAKTQGVLRPRDLVPYQIHPRNLSMLCERGTMLRTGRGLYTLTEGEQTEHHTLVEVARRVPRGVIGLTSALSYYELTDEMPHKVWIFIGRKARKPIMDYPPLEVFRCDADQLLDDAVSVVIEGTDVRITSIARTVVDCFKHRRVVGIEVAIQALREVLEKRLCTLAEVSRLAEKRHVRNVMRPYLQAFQ